MKNLLLTFSLIVLTGCAGLRPYGGEKSVTLDLSGEATAIFERLPEGLLVTVEVEDDQLVIDPERELWFSDGVEFYADLRPYRLRAVNKYEPGVFQILVRPPAGEVPSEWCFLSTGCPVPEGFWADAVETDEGYTVQFFLPEKDLQEIHGSIRDILYMDVAVNDVDAEGKSRKIFWKGNGDNWQYPHNFAPFTLP